MRDVHPFGLRILYSHWTKHLHMVEQRHGKKTMKFHSHDCQGKLHFVNSFAFGWNWN
uniref:Cc-nbs-lrr resistance protein n=1 Tax=Solanum tuberosum TaxID=4113 RepID=M1AGA6_SOLTU